MAEFKKLSEVEVLETSSDNATVLVEEGGDIKRVPKKEVGGAGGYVIHLGSDSVTTTDYGFECTDNYDELYDVLMAGGSVWVDYENAPEYVEPRTMIAEADPTGPNAATNWGAPLMLAVTAGLSDVGLMVLDYNGATIFFPNGSHNLDPIEAGGK